MTAATKKTSASEPRPLPKESFQVRVTRQIQEQAEQIAALQEQVRILQASGGRQRGLSPSVHNTEYAIKRHGEKWGVWSGRGKNLTLVEDFESPAECKAHIAKLAAPASA